MSAMTLEEAEKLLIDGTVTVSEAVNRFGIGRTKLYALMGSGELPYSAKMGRRLIPVVALRRLIASGMTGVDQSGTTPKVA